jgi:hypothetical protein
MSRRHRDAHHRLRIVVGVSEESIPPPRVFIAAQSVIDEEAAFPPSKRYRRSVSAAYHLGPKSKIMF